MARPIGVAPPATKVRVLEPTGSSQVSDSGGQLLTGRAVRAGQFGLAVIDSGVVEDDLAARRLEGERDVDLLRQGRAHGRALLRRHEQEKEAAPASAGQFPADGPGGARLVVE